MRDGRGESGERKARKKTVKKRGSRECAWGNRKKR